MTAESVVSKIVTLGEREFHDRLVAGWARVIPLVGRGTFADAIDMTPQGLGKVLGGSTPHACTILNSRKAHPSALDELFAGYRVRLVPAEATASTDDRAGLALLRAAHKCIEAEADGITDHHELFAMEAELRESHAQTACLLARIDQLRGVGGSR